jgi:hypothetical protein
MGRLLHRRKHSLGRYIAATNELNATYLSNHAMLENYNDQDVSVDMDLTSARRIPACGGRQTACQELHR